jgi:hypothetical protein
LPDCETDKSSRDEKKSDLIFVGSSDPAVLDGKAAANE